MMGMAGNKGAVAIRMEYGDTSFCFLAAHFASGNTYSYAYVSIYYHYYYINAFINIFY